MAANTKNDGPKAGVLASLKGAWSKVAGRRRGAGAAAPGPAGLQIPGDDAAATPARVTETVVEAPVDAPRRPAPVEVPAAETPQTEAPAAEVPAEAPAAEAPVEAPAAEQQDAARAAETPIVGTVEPEVAPAAEAEPVSEPLDVASPEAAKAIRKPAAQKAPKPVSAQDPALEDSAPAPRKTASTFVAPASTESNPDSSWTVAQLRALAKERGVRGYSSMSKAQLLGSLAGPQA